MRKRKPDGTQKLLDAVIHIPELEDIKFYPDGRAVMVRTNDAFGNGSGLWCEILKLNNTPEAQRMAEQRAEITAAALNEYYSAADISK